MNKTALRSKQAIVTALFNKLASYPFNELTISEIAAEANVSRKTFYHHFPSKFAIIQYYTQSTVQAYLAKVADQKIKNFHDLLCCYFSFWQEQRHELLVLQKNNLLGFVFEAQRQQLLQMLPQQAMPWHSPTKDETVIDLLIIGGVWNILLYYLTPDRLIDPEKLTRIIINSLKDHLVYLRD